MKIQSFGCRAFFVVGDEAKIVFDPESGFSEVVDIATNSCDEGCDSVDSKKSLTLPGEYEVSGVLVMGYFSDGKNVVYKAVVDGISLVHFGVLSAIPDTAFFDKLGENIDVVFVSLSEQFDEKLAKQLIEQLEPRIAFLGGDAAFFPKMVEILGAKNVGENSMKVSRSQFSDDKTEVLILEG